MKYKLRKDLIEVGEYPSMFCCIEGYENDTPKCIADRLLNGETFDGWTLGIDAEFNILVKIDDKFYRFPSIDFEDAENPNTDLIIRMGEMEASLIDLGLSDDCTSKIFDSIRTALENC